jgi:hypothetical protein
MKWPWNNPPKKPSNAQPPHPASPIRSDLNMFRWREQPQNTANLRRAFLEHGILKDWLSVAWAHIPRGGPPRSTPINDTEASIELGRVQGYMQCLDLLQACFDYRPEPTKTPPMTYPKSVEETFDENT